MENGSASSSTSYFSTPGWMLCGPIDLCVSKWYSRLLTFFPHGLLVLHSLSHPSDFHLSAQGPSILITLCFYFEDWDKEDIRYHSLFFIFFYYVSAYITKGQRFSLALLVLQMCLSPFTAVTILSSSWVLALLIFFPAQPHDIHVALQSSLLLLPV